VVVAGLHVQVELAKCMLRVVGPLPGQFPLEVQTGSGLIVRNRAIATTAIPRLPRHLGSPTALAAWVIPPKDSATVLAQGCPPRNSTLPPSLDLAWGGGGQGLSAVLDDVGNKVDQALQNLLVEIESQAAAASEQDRAAKAAGGRARTGRGQYTRQILMQVQQVRDQLSQDIQRYGRDQKSSAPTIEGEQDADDPDPHWESAVDPEDSAGVVLESISKLGDLVDLSRRVLSGVLLEEERRLFASGKRRPERDDQDIWDSPCAQCGNMPSSPQRCGRCSQAVYCSRECQAAHWPSHRAPCAEIAQRKAQRESLEPDGWGSDGFERPTQGWAEAVETLRVPTMGGMLQMYDTFLQQGWLQVEHAALSTRSTTAGEDGSEDSEGDEPTGRLQQQTDKLEEMMNNTKAVLAAALAAAEDEAERTVDHAEYETSPHAPHHRPAHAEAMRLTPERLAQSPSRTGAGAPKKHSRFRKWLGKVAD